MPDDKSTKKYLSLYEAWELIPRFNGDEVNHVDEVINAAMYVASHIDPANQSDLLSSILKTKIQGNAAVNLSLKKITTFEQLKDELIALYRRRRSIATIKFEWKTCRQKQNESVAEFSLRFTHLMKELIIAFTKATRSSRIQRNIPKFIRRVALNYYVDGLKSNYKKSKDRGYPDLPAAIMRAMSEEKLEKYPHLANLKCNWCGDCGHLYNNCYERMRHERKLQYRGLTRS